MDKSSFIWGAVVGGLALWYFISKDKTNEKTNVEILPVKTVHVHSEPEYVSRKTYTVPQNITYAPRPVVQQPVIFNTYTPAPVIVPPCVPAPYYYGPRHFYRHHYYHHCRPHFRRCPPYHFRHYRHCW